MSSTDFENVTFLHFPPKFKFKNYVSFFKPNIFAGPIVVPDVLPTQVQSNQVPSLLAIKSEPPEMNSR